MTGGDPDPLIVTLEADPVSQARFDDARERRFPPERNLIPAHVTLFHRLPGEQADAVALRLSHVTRARAPPHFRVASVMALGRGAAYRLDLLAGNELRRAIGAGFEAVVQDCGALRAHVMVQNKVSSARRSESAWMRASRQPGSGAG